MERRVHRLLYRQDEAAVLVLARAIENRRPGDVVPALELAKVDAGGVLHRLDKVVGGYGLAVVPLEVRRIPA